MAVVGQSCSNASTVVMMTELELPLLRLCALVIAPLCPAALCKGGSMPLPGTAAPISTHPDDVRVPLNPADVGNLLRVAVARGLLRAGHLWRVNFSIAGDLAGQTVRVPLVAGLGWEHLRMREVWLFHFLQWALDQRAGAVVDVGVNVGQTLLKVKAAAPGRTYVGFEPNPHCLQYTQQLIQLNRFQHCTLVPVGLSDRNGLATMLLNPDADPSATLVEGFREPERYRRAMMVPVAVGDEVLPTVVDGPIAAIKIDVEGGELDVLRGLVRTLESQRPVIVCEVLPVFDPASEIGHLRLSRQSAVRDLLRRFDYQMYRIHLDETTTEVDGFGVHGDLTLTNYVFVPPGQRASFARRFARSSR